MDLDFMNSERATTHHPSIPSTMGKIEDDQRTMITQSYRRPRFDIYLRNLIYPDEVLKTIL